MLMFLAFAVDQIQQAAYKVFQEARIKTRTFYSFCQRIIVYFYSFKINSWLDLLSYIIDPSKIIIYEHPS